MDLERALYSRRSVRAYAATPVAEATIRQLIDAAVQAPSAVNEQPWIFSVVRDPPTLSRIATAAKAHLLPAPLDHELPAPLRDMLASPAFDIFYGAPALIVISSASSSPWAAVNCALAAENLMLAARNAELGTCWIGFAQPWLGTPAGKAAIGVSANSDPVAPIVLGRPEAEPPPVQRKEPEIIWIGG
jgi:nitroreductase